MRIASLPRRYAVERTFLVRTQPPSWQAFREPTDWNRTMAKVGKSDCEGTFAGAFGNDGVAPIPAIGELAIEPRDWTRCRQSAVHKKRLPSHQLVSVKSITGVSRRDLRLTSTHPSQKQVPRR